MKRMLIVLLVLGMVVSGKAQSVYGDEAKADVGMKYVYSFEEALKKAKAEHRLIFFNCFADWAIPCHAMNKLVFSDQNFADWMDKRFVNLFMDVTKPEGRPLAAKYNVKTQAHYLVLDETGEIVHRIQGGYPIEEFKVILEQALNPKTSQVGMNERYKAGEKSVKFLAAYANGLNIAGENEAYQEVVGELFDKLKPKDYAKKEYWKFYISQLSGLDDEKFAYLIGHKADFVKSNGLDAVNKAISNLYFAELYPYATGDKAYDGKKLLDIYLGLQKAELPETELVYALYYLAKYRGERQFDKMMTLLESQSSAWPMQIAGNVDLTLGKIKELSKKEQNRLVAYLKDKAEKSGAKKHYMAVIAEIENTDGIEFEESSFAEALKKAKEQGKLLFVDYYTTWCAPCKMMSLQVFPQKAVGDYFKEHFVSLKVDMEKGEGPELGERYGVKAFPTMFVLDAEGQVIGTMVGSRDLDSFMTEIKNFVEK